MKKSQNYSCKFIKSLYDNLYYLDGIKNILGESPFWWHNKNIFLWVDILKKQSIHLKKEKINFFPANNLISLIVPTNRNSFIVATKNKLILLNNKGEYLKTLITLPLAKNERFNDGKCDNQGRLWIGTMNMECSKPSGKLYCLNNDLSFFLKKQNFYISNGIGWSPDNKFMYFTDSYRREIYKFNFNLKNGEISDKTIFIKLSKKIGCPDGLAVDIKGNIWSAIWDGAKIICFNPKGKTKDIINLPVLRPTSCCFGGKEMDILFITSATIDLTKKQLTKYPLSGYILYKKLNVKGMKNNLFKFHK